jgi:hypothetical protein
MPAAPTAGLPLHVATVTSFQASARNQPNG